MRRVARGLTRLPGAVLLEGPAQPRGKKGRCARAGGEVSPWEAPRAFCVEQGSRLPDRRAPSQEGALLASSPAPTLDGVPAGSQGPSGADLGAGGTRTGNRRATSVLRCRVLVVNL